MYSAHWRMYDMEGIYTYTVYTMDFCTALHEYSQVLDGMLQIHGIPRDSIQFYVILDDLKLSLTSSRSPL